MQRNFSVLHGPTANFIAPSWYAHKRMIRIMMKTISNGADENYNDSIELRDGLKEQHDEHLATMKNGIHGSSFTEVLHILCNEVYHHKDAFPELCKVYGMICAIPISSCTAERSFSALKRVKTRLRSTMVQERLEGLLLLSVERETLLTLTKESIIDSLHVYPLTSQVRCCSSIVLHGWTGALNPHPILLQLHMKMTVTILL